MSASIPPPRLARRLLPGLGLLLTGCGAASVDGDTATAATAECGDVDGPGGDTGDVPNVLGAWTVDFGHNIYQDVDCSVPGLEQDDLVFLSGALHIDGRIPDNLYATFTIDDTRYWGLENHLGGIVFTGQRVVTGHTLHVTFGGQLYEQPAVERTQIRGFAYIGVDIDSDGSGMDCSIQADFKATKSGQR